MLRGLRNGSVTIHDGDRTVTCGDTTSDLRAKIHVTADDFYRRLFWGSELGLAESLLREEWNSPDLTAVVRVFARNLGLADRQNQTFAWWKFQWNRWLDRLRWNSHHGARKNIAAHYDLSNRFFSQFLDESLSYSCGLFRHPAESMREASYNKLERVADWLDLRPSDHLLEIGTGWGGLAIHFASSIGCRVTTTTISRQQFEFARERVRAAGVEDRVTVLQRDYRELEGRYDKLVSIEMIEAVGHRYLELFFAKCASLLTHHGRMFLQSIVINDQRFERHVRGTDFIRRYIFPGGCLPSVERMLQATRHATDFQLQRFENLTEHYVTTLQRWQRQFLETIDEIRRLGFDDRFIRLWRYYFCYCEAGFAERQIHLTQLLFAKPRAFVAPVDGNGPHAADGIDRVDRTDRTDRTRRTDRVADEIPAPRHSPTDKNSVESLPVPADQGER